MDSANGGRVSSQLTQEACSVFQEAISLILSRWTALQMALENEWGGRDSQNKYDQLAADIFSWFTRSKEAMYIDDLENILDESMVLSFNTELEDGSIEEVAEQLMSIHEGCLQGSYEAIERLRSTNLGAKAVSQNIQVVNENDDSSSEEEEEPSDMTVEKPKPGVHSPQRDVTMVDQKSEERREVEDGWSVVANRRNRGKRN